MADYREHYEKIRAADADLVAISVDPPEKSEAVRQQLHLPFAILCDTDRRVIQEWGVFNAREKGGIAKSAVFVMDRNRKVRFASVDAVATRVPAFEVIRILQTATAAQPAHRKFYLPGLDDWFRAIRNSIRLGVPRSRT